MILSLFDAIIGRELRLTYMVKDVMRYIVIFVSGVLTILGLVLISSM